MVPEPTRQVAAPGEAGGERHPAAGHPLVPVLLRLPLHQPPARLRGSTPGPLAHHPDHQHHRRLVSAHPPGVHRRRAGALSGGLRLTAAAASPLHDFLHAGYFPPLRARTRVQPSPAPPYRLYMSAGAGLLLLGVHGQVGPGGIGPAELQHRVPQDEGQGTHPVLREDVVARWGDFLLNLYLYKRTIRHFITCEEI